MTIKVFMTKFTLPDGLKEALKNGKLIPFVGAGVSMSVIKAGSEESLFPSWKTLLLNSTEEIRKQRLKESAASLIQAHLEHGENDAYLKAAELAKKTLGNHAWNTFLKEQISLSYTHCEPSSLKLSQSIWQLNSQLIITTNYDKVLDWACPEDKRHDLEHWDIETVHEQARSLSTELTQPTVWHLHGRISNANNLILTPDGYTHLYSEDGDAAKYKTALETLKIRLSTHQFLFIGFSFDDEVFANALKAVSELFDQNLPNHYVLIKESQVDKINDLDLPLIPVPYNSHDDLPELLSELSSYVKESSAIESQQITSVEPPITKSDFDINNVVFNLPHRAKGDGVIGREEVLLKLRQQLTSGHQTNIGHAASFRGMGGLGKTQLAVEYAHKHKNNYPNGVFWIEADSDINTQLLQMAEKTKWFSPHLEDTDVLSNTLVKLKNTSDCLIIFDNVESHDQIKPYLPTVQATPHLLITSRIDLNGFTALPLELLTSEQSVELLIKEANRSHIEHSEEEHAACIAIVEVLGHLPLAIELAGAYCKKYPSISFKKYKSLLDTNLEKALPTNTHASFTDHQAGLFNTLSITENEIAQSPLIKDILLLLSWSATASMGTSLMATLLAVSEEDLIEPLALGVELRLLSSTDNDRYAIHRLLKEIQRELHPIEKMEGWAQTTCQRMISWFKERKDEFLDLKDYQAEIDHLESWGYLAEKNKWYEAIALMWLQAYPLWHLAEYKKSEFVLQKALNLFEQTQQEETQDNQILHAHLLADLSTIYSELHSFSKALDHGQKALKLRLNLLGTNHLDTILSYNNVGSVFNGLGDYQTALEYLEKALAISEALSEEEHANTALSYNNIGGTYGGLGEHKEALKFLEKALQIRIVTFGEEHPNTATVYQNIGSTYSKLGEHENALKYKEKSLKIRIAGLGEEHPNTAAGYNSVGITYRKLGDNETALEYQKKALTINITNYVLDPSEIINSLWGVVKCLILQKYYTVALSELTQLKKLALKDRKIKFELKKMEQHIRQEAAKSGVRLASSNNKKKPKRR